MIAKRDEPPGRRDLLLGDEPADLARGRLLFDLAPPEAPLRPVFPGKGDVPPPTAAEGEAAEWLLHRRPGPLPGGREWLVALAAADEDRPVPEGAPGATALREIAVLLSSARRSAAHDLPHAFRALASPPDVVRRDPLLAAYREECRLALTAALRARPRFAWRTALVVCPCAEAVEDILAARWQSRFPDRLVLAANPARAEGRVLLAWHSPPGHDAPALLGGAWPAGAPPFRLRRGGLAGRAALDPGECDRLLAALRFRRSERAPR